MSATNQLTAGIIKFLNASGFKTWRQNNGAVFSKKKNAFLKNPNHLLGISDIIGFRLSDGKFIAVEVKIKKDKLSIHQELFLEDVRKAGGIALVAWHDFDNFEKIFKAYMALEFMKSKVTSGA